MIKTLQKRHVVAQINGSTRTKDRSDRPPHERIIMSNRVIIEKGKKEHNHRKGIVGQKDNQLNDSAFPCAACTLVRRPYPHMFLGRSRPPYRRV